MLQSHSSLVFLAAEEEDLSKIRANVVEKPNKTKLQVCKKKIIKICDLFDNCAVTEQI